MDQNMFGKPEENEKVSLTKAEGQQPANTEDENRRAEQPETAGQYYIGSMPKYVEDVQNTQNIYSGEGMSSQSVYSSPYIDQNSQNTYFSYNNQNDQGSGPGSYNDRSGQNPYASYPDQNGQGMYSGTSGYSDYQGGQQNAQNAYSYGGQTEQNTYTYGTQANQGQAGGGNPYAAPSYGQNYTGYQGYKPELEEPVKMGEWLLLQCLLSFIPCVGLILAIVWAFSKTEKQSKVNFCKAYLIVVLIRLVLSLFIILMWGGIILAALDGMY